MKALAISILVPLSAGIAEASDGLIYLECPIGVDIDHIFQEEVVLDTHWKRAYVDQFEMNLHTNNLEYWFNIPTGIQVIINRSDLEVESGKFFPSSTGYCEIKQIPKNKI